jgi:hypothetical protein
LMVLQMVTWMHDCNIVPSCCTILHGKGVNCLVIIIILL